MVARGGVQHSATAGYTGVQSMRDNPESEKIVDAILGLTKNLEPRLLSVRFA
jgi:hypothetical protein